MDTINERRSIRKYRDKPVDKQLIADIIDAGRAAPSAKNRQPWKYIGNTAQSPPDGFALNLRTYFPSSCTEIP